MMIHDTQLKHKRILDNKSMIQKHVDKINTHKEAIQKQIKTKQNKTTKSKMKDTRHITKNIAFQIYEQKFEKRNKYKEKKKKRLYPNKTN